MACVLVSLCACACRSVFIIDHGRVEATEKEADERRKGGRRSTALKARVASATRRIHVTARIWKRRRKDPRRCCCENAGEEEDGDETVSDGGRDDESALDDTTTTTTTRGGAARFTAVEIFEDEDRGTLDASIDLPELRHFRRRRRRRRFRRRSSSKSALTPGRMPWSVVAMKKPRKRKKGTTPTKTTLKWKKTVLVPSRAMPTCRRCRRVADSVVRVER